jgi:spore coat protein A
MPEEHGESKAKGNKTPKEAKVKKEKVLTKPQDKEENSEVKKSKRTRKTKTKKDAVTIVELEDTEIVEEIGMKVNPLDPTTIPKFVDPMPIPDIARPEYTYNSSDKLDIFYHIVMTETKHKFHKYFPYTTVWGYNGTYPGPTIEVRKDIPVKVKWDNQLPNCHFLPVDHTLHGTMDTPDVRTVVHLHGANVEADSDGHPEAWFTNDYHYVGQKFSREVYEYTNHQPGCCLWYHDHAIGITRLNVYAGLAGFYLIRDFLEERLNLPKDNYDIPIMIQDKSFDECGELFYPKNATPPVDNPVPSTPSFFFGNTICVNGKLWPYLKVEPRKYRFRILNASNLRAYELKLDNDEIFYQIGTDQGLLHKPEEIKSFILEPAERIDLIIDFSKYKGQEITLLNNVIGPPSPGMNLIMKFIVDKKVKCPDRSIIPCELMPCHKIDPKLAIKERTLQLGEKRDCYDRVLHLLDGKNWNDPATETPKLDTIEIWHLVNNFDFPHPIHVHLVDFHILNRKPFTDLDFDENGNYKFNLEDIDPDTVFDYEKGPKDVVRTDPHQVTTIIMHFKEHYGDYVWHCHILEHEDNDMMRPLRVEKD